MYIEIYIHLDMDIDIDIDIDIYTNIHKYVYTDFMLSWDIIIIASCNIWLRHESWARQPRSSHLSHAHARLVSHNAVAKCHRLSSHLRSLQISWSNHAACGICKSANMSACDICKICKSVFDPPTPRAHRDAATPPPPQLFPHTHKSNAYLQILQALRGRLWSQMAFCDLRLPLLRYHHTCHTRGHNASRETYRIDCWWKKMNGPDFWQTLMTETYQPRPTCGLEPRWVN